MPWLALPTLSSFTWLVLVAVLPRCPRIRRLLHSSPLSVDSHCSCGLFTRCKSSRNTFTSLYLSITVSGVLPMALERLTSTPKLFPMLSLTCWPNPSSASGSSSLMTPCRLRKIPLPLTSYHANTPIGPYPSKVSGPMDLARKVASVLVTMTRVRKCQPFGNTIKSLKRSTSTMVSANIGDEGDMNLKWRALACETCLMG